MSNRFHTVLFAAMVLALAAIAPPAAASHDVIPARVAGPDRVDTAAAVAELAHPNGASTALLARADHWPDALAGVPLAGVLGAPILLTNTSDVPAATSQVLARLGVDNIVLLGGPGAITPGVEQALARNYAVERIWGSTHYGTAAAVARAVAARGDIGATPGGMRSAFLASGATFPDALAAGAPAALGPNRMPILLSAPNALPPETTAALDDLPIEQVLIVGGTAAISEAVDQQLEGRGLNVVRLAGATRTQTAAEIADFAVDILPATPEVVHIARSDAFPDALSAGPLAASLGGPLLLTQDTDQLGAAAAQWLAARCAEVRVVRAVGGSLAVTPAVLNEAEQAAQSCHPGGDQPVNLTQSCTHEERGVTVNVRYPQGWHANDPAVQACTAFDPEPFTLQPNTQIPRDLAVLLFVEPLGFDQAVNPTGLRVDEQRSLTVDGRRAVRQVVTTTGEGLGPAGQQATRYVIDGGTDRSILATTWNVAGNDYGENVQVLDAMAGAFDIQAAPDGDDGGDGGLDGDDVLSPDIDTQPDLAEASGPMVSVTDVRLGRHNGFDRLVFEIGGEGQAGWDVRYVDEATSAGSGRPIDVEGDAILQVSLRNIALPPNAPAGVEPWDGPDRLGLPGSGPIAEVVEDTVFEGRHTFFVGVTEKVPFQVHRLGTPQRVVVDVAAA